MDEEITFSERYAWVFYFILHLDDQKSILYTLLLLCNFYLIDPVKIQWEM